MFFHWSLSDGRSPQVSRTRLSILAILRNVVVWRVSTRPPNSKSFRSLDNPLVCLKHQSQLTQSSLQVKILILLFTFLQLYSVVRRDSKVEHFANSPFLLIMIRTGLLVMIGWSVCMFKSHMSLCVLFSRTGAGVLHIPFVSMVRFIFVAHFQLDHLADPVVSRFILLLC